MLCKKCNKPIFISQDVVICENCKEIKKLSDYFINDSIDLYLYNYNEKGLQIMYKNILKENNSYMKIKRLIDYFGVIIRFLAIRIINKVKEYNIIDDNFEFLINEKLKLPMESLWNSIIKNGLQLLIKENCIDDEIKKIMKIYQKIEIKVKKKDMIKINKEFIDSDGSIVNNTVSLSYITGFISLRNEFAHGYKLSENKCNNLFHLLYSLINRIMNVFKEEDYYIKFNEDTVPILLYKNNSYFVYDKTSFNNIKRYVEIISL